jgi:Ca-activated chloride channel family protein
MIGDFHFLRPSWVLALVPCALLVWAIQRREDATQSWQGIVAPHLLPFCCKTRTAAPVFTPLHLIAIGWFVAVLAIAGPTWRREPSPFADDTAALAIVVKVSPSMNTEDVQPAG